MWNCIGKSNKTSDYKRKLLKRMLKESKECFLQDKEAEYTQGNNNDQDYQRIAESGSNLALVVLSVLKCLDKEELSSLDTAVEWGNSGVTPCVHLKWNFISQWSGDPKRPHIQTGTNIGLIDPLYAVCLAWRWSNLSPKEQLLPLCSSSALCEGKAVCVNPNHYSRVTKNNSTVDENCDVKKEIASIMTLQKKQTNLIEKCLSTLKDLDCDSQPCSCEDEKHPLVSQPWCTISYWELLHHVRNSWLPVSHSVFHIFSQLHTGNGLCLADLVGPYTQSAHYNHPPPSCCCGDSSGNLRENKSGCGSSLGGNGYSTSLTSGYWIPNAAEKIQIQRCREKIGAGITLLRQSLPSSPHNYKVWVYNRSEQPVFVSSPTLLPSDNWEEGVNAPLVVRLQPGYSTIAFDSIVYEAVQSLRSSSKSIATSSHNPKQQFLSSENILPSHPGESMNHKVIHVSFGKGWGCNYRRQDATMCPCRLEVILADEKRACF